MQSKEEVLENLIKKSEENLERQEQLRKQIKEIANKKDDSTSYNSKFLMAMQEYIKQDIPLAPVPEL